MKKIIVVALPVLLFVLIAYGATAGPNFGGSASQSTSGARDDWTGLDNVLAADDVNAICVLAENQLSETISITNFGFSIPASATINGILVEIKRHRAAELGSAKDHFVRVLKNGSPTGSDNKASASTYPTVSGWASYGGVSDLWSLSWIAGDVNATNFGMEFICTDVDGLDTVLVDAVRITITYTESGKRKRAPVVIGTHMSLAETPTNP